MPKEWHCGTIVPDLKKGDPRICDNYRGISLLNTVYKILTTLINKRLSNITERKLGEYQYGFRKGRSTIDAIHVMNQIVEKCYEHNIQIHILFIDFRQAFDSIKRNMLIEDMRKMEVPNKLINLTKMTMTETKTTVSTKRGVTNEFEFNSGVRQGDGLSTTLFNIVLDGVMRDCGVKGTIINKTTQVIAYADDLAVITRDMRSLKEVLKNIINAARKRGLEINEQKTKYMQINRDSKASTEKDIQIENFKLEVVDNFKYLGTTINNQNDRKIEIAQRIQAGHRASYKYKTLMGNKKISKNTKIRIYKAAIKPVVTYGAECMNLTTKDEEQLRIFERKLIRRIHGPKKLEDGDYRRLRYNEIRDILKGEDIVRTIKAQRLRWYGHIKRIEKNTELRNITEWNPQESNRVRGRPKSRWEDQVRGDIASLGIQGWNEKIQDRKKWKEITEQAKTSNKP